MNNVRFNFCSFKVCCSHKDDKGKCIKKETHWHSDVNLDKDRVPQSKNSQAPGKPVIIFPFGNPKHLWFQKNITKKMQCPTLCDALSRTTPASLCWMEEMNSK
jgi:hypothetical protein